MCMNDRTHQGLSYNETLNGLAALVSRYNKNSVEYDPVAGHQKSTKIDHNDAIILQSALDILTEMRGSYK